MNVILFRLLLCAILPASAHQADVIKGEVTTMLGKPLRGVHVILKDMDFKTLATSTTNQNGRFSFPAIDGARRVALSKEGYININTGLREDGKYALRLRLSPAHFTALRMLKGKAFFSRMCELVASDEFEGKAIAGLFPLGERVVPFLIRALSDDRPVGSAGKRQRTLRVHAAKVLSHLGSDEGVKALRHVLATAISPSERQALEQILISALADSTDDDDLALIRGFLIPGREKLEADWGLPIGPATMLGVSRHEKAEGLLKEALRLAGDDLRPLATSAIRDSLSWIELRKSRQSDPPVQGVSERGRVAAVIRSTLSWPDKREVVIKPESILFTPDRDRAHVGVRVWTTGYDVLLKKKKDVWVVVGVWFTWIS